MTDTTQEQDGVTNPNTKEEPESDADADVPVRKLIDHEDLIKHENIERIESINGDELYAKMSREELLEVCRNSNSYISGLETKLANLEAEIITLKSAETYPKQRDSTYREKILLRKLALKDQEIQDYAAQINEFKAAQIPALATLKSTLLDPAINIIVQKLKNELSSTKASLEETQNELNAWKFTPDSNTGKRLMAKCRLLHQENEELGKMISSGRVAKLEGELALQKSFSEEVKKSQFELDELLQDLDEDVEGMQGTIYYLQQELKKSKEKISDLEAKNQELHKLTDDSSPALGKDDIESGAMVVDSELKKPLDKTDVLNQNLNVEDESSNDSSCLILKVNPEEEYESMFNDESTKTEDKKLEMKTKRGLVDDGFKGVLPKKPKRSSNSKRVADKD